MTVCGQDRQSARFSSVVKPLKKLAFGVGIAVTAGTSVTLIRDGGHGVEGLPVRYAASSEYVGAEEIGLMLCHQCCLGFKTHLFRDEVHSKYWHHDLPESWIMSSRFRVNGHVTVHSIQCNRHPMRH